MAIPINVFPPRDPPVLIAVDMPLVPEFPATVPPEVDPDHKKISIPINI